MAASAPSTICVRTPPSASIYETTRRLRPSGAPFAQPRHAKRTVATAVRDRAQGREYARDWSHLEQAAPVGRGRGGVLGEIVDLILHEIVDPLLTVFKGLFVQKHRAS